MSLTVCAKCAARFTSEKNLGQHVGRDGACLGPELVPTLRKTPTGLWGTNYLGGPEYYKWQAEKQELSRYQIEDFRDWEYEMGTTDEELRRAIEEGLGA